MRRRERGYARGAGLESNFETWKEMSSMLGRYGPWLIVGLVVLTIFGLSHQPHSAEFTQRFLGQYNFIARKAAHCVVYAALFMALSSPLPARSRTRRQAGLVGGA